MGVGGVVTFDVQAERRWLTAAEAADEKLPEFASSKSQVNRIISARGIKTRRRVGRGGGREFHWTELPRAAREEYLRRYGVAAAEDADQTPAAKSACKDLRAEARALIVEAALRFVAEHNEGIERGLTTFAKLHAKRRTKLPDWVYGVEPDAAVHRVRVWDRKIRKAGTGALIDARGRRKGSGLLDRDTALRTYIVAAIAARPHLSCPQLRAAITADLSREIPLRTVQAFVAEFRTSNAGALKALSNPDAHRSHHKPAFGSRSMAVTRINQLWEIDATRADAMCLAPDGSRRRMALTAVIDVFTRRAMVLVSDQPRALATQALLRRALIAWGQCETLKLDNGKEFAARAVLDFCRAANIAMAFSRPFHPEEKPHIERFFGTLNHQLLPMLPGFVGANIGQRKAIEARASFSHRFGEEARLAIETSLSPAALQSRLDVYLHEVYGRAQHEGLHGRSPFQMALAFGADARRIADERALDALLLPAPDTGGIRMVVKKGIRIANRWYIHEELGPLCALHARVSVRLDPHDPSRIVVYSDDGSRFVCVAECADDMAPAEMQRIATVAQAKADQSIRRIREDVRKVQRIFPADGLADRVLAHAAGDGFSLTPDAQRAMTAAESPRLIEHARAAAALDVSRDTIVPPLTEEQEQRAAEVLAEMHAKTAAPPVKLVQCDGYMRPACETDADQYIWFDDFRRKGGRLDTQDEALFREYSERRSLMDLVNIKRRAG